MATIKDNLQIVKHLTIQRMLNIVLLRCSYYLSRLLKKAIIWGRPFAVSIEPTTACNLACPECPSGLKNFSRPSGRLKPEENQNMLQQIGKQVFYINYYFQGEPFLNPSFLDLVRDAKKQRIYTATSTNAHFIDRKKAEEIVLSGLDRLIISIDGTTQESYESYRVNGSLSKVLQATEYLTEAKEKYKMSTPHLIFQFLVVRPNEHEIPEILEWGRKYKVNEVRLKTAQVYDYENGNPLIPDNQKYARYIKKKDGTYRMKYKTGNHCWRMWSSSVLTWDGRVVPCCFDKDASVVLGTTGENNFGEIWKSKRYNNFREAVLNNRNQIEICKNCSEGSKVWVE